LPFFHVFPLLKLALTLPLSFLALSLKEEIKFHLFLDYEQRRPLSSPLFPFLPLFFCCASSLLIDAFRACLFWLNEQGLIFVVLDRQIFEEDYFFVFLSQEFHPDTELD